ncbi:MAG: DUF1566 domain-containing protein, partial [Syntrophales bacterium]
NSGIKNSKILPPEGLPLKIKYRISDSKEIKALWNLKLTMVECDPDKIKSAQSKPIAENTQKAKEEEAKPTQPNIQEIKRDGQFIAYDNGTVLDSKTGLMWAAKDNWRNIDWRDAESYCKNYRGGGYSDWRMPTLDELAGLYDADKSRPGACNTSYPIHVTTELIDITCFTPWTSETRGSDAALFTFYSGIRSWYPKSYDFDTRALPVRTAK